MTDRQLQAKLNTIARLCNEVTAEAKLRYGRDASLFYEAEGSFHVMSGDSIGSVYDRQQFVKFSSKGNCHLGAGAW